MCQSIVKSRWINVINEYHACSQETYKQILILLYMSSKLDQVWHMAKCSLITRIYSEYCTH